MDTALTPLQVTFSEEFGFTEQHIHYTLEKANTPEELHSLAMQYVSTQLDDVRQQLRGTPLEKLSTPDLLEALANRSEQHGERAVDRYRADRAAANVSHGALLDGVAGHEMDDSYADAAGFFTEAALYQYAIQHIVA